MVKATVNDFDKIFKIMQGSFPADEYRYREEQLALFDDSAYTVYLKKEGEQIVAFLAVWEFDDFIFLEHFAVDKSYRARGLGSQMLKEVAKQYLKPICLEVELPTTDISKRRVKFYERNGYFFNDYTYYQPPISKGKNAIALRIMSNKSPLSRVEFETVKSTLYTKVYKTDFKY